MSAPSDSPGGRIVLPFKGQARNQLKGPCHKIRTVIQPDFAKGKIQVKLKVQEIKPPSCKPTVRCNL